MRKLDNSGVVMAEILVAFVILMMAAAMLTTSVHYSEQMMIKAKNLDVFYEKQQSAAAAYFAGDEPYYTSKGGLNEITYTSTDGSMRITVEGATVTVPVTSTESINYKVFSTYNETGTY